MNKQNTSLAIIFFLLGLFVGATTVGGFWMANTLEEVKTEKEVPKDTAPSEEIVDAEDSKLNEEGIKVGDKAPDFTLPEFYENKEMSLSDYKGKKVIVTFFASWCPYCEKEAPDLEKIHKEYGPDVQVLLVDLATSEAKPEDVDAFIKRTGVTAPVVVDFTGEVANTYRVEATPTNYFINTDGTIAKSFSGAITYEDMKSILSEMK